MLNCYILAAGVLIAEMKQKKFQLRTVFGVSPCLAWNGMKFMTKWVSDANLVDDGGRPGLTW